MRHRYERGQILPLWAGAIITTLMFAFLAANYGNTVRYQIRAQNAADAMAQGLMTMQSERFNNLQAALYITGIEEYRLRHLLDGILLAANDSGGCEDYYGSGATFNTGGFYNFNPANAAGTCAAMYANLTTEYGYSLNRYTNDALLVNDFSSYSTWQNWTKDTAALMTHLTSSTCNTANMPTPNPDGTDCAFIYQIVPGGQIQRTGLQCVYEDSQDIMVPSLGRSCPNGVGTGLDSENQQLFAPGQIEVTACAVIPPLVPNFGPLQMGRQYALGRAAATIAQFEEDWLDPGAIYDPVKGTSIFFQPQETYTSAWTTPGDTSEEYNWYGVMFGGNGSYISQNSFVSPVYQNEFSVRMGWWNALAMKPFVPNTSISASKACTRP